MRDDYNKPDLECKAQIPMTINQGKSSHDKPMSNSLPGYQTGSAQDGGAMSVHLVTPKGVNAYKPPPREPETPALSLANSDDDEGFHVIDLVEPIQREPEYPVAQSSDVNDSRCFNLGDSADSPSNTSDSSPKTTPPPSTRKRRHKFGTNDSDEDPDWSAEKEEGEAVGSTSGSPTLLTPTKLKRGRPRKVRAIERDVGARERRPRQRKMASAGKPDSWTSPKRIHASNTEIMIDSSDDVL